MSVIKYIKRKTKEMTPSERFIWLEKHIYSPLRIESIKYVNGQAIPVSDDPETVGEAILKK
jgi:hypothetical protein